jgi:Recombination endonuclease VII
VQTPESKQRARERHVLRTYGVTPDMHAALAEYQGGRCWGCRRATGASKALAVDHDHRTGEVRMLLCSTCNRLIGHFRDDPVALVRLGLALVEPPSRRAWWLVGPRPGW